MLPVSALGSALSARAVPGAGASNPLAGAVSGAVNDAVAGATGGIAGGEPGAGRVRGLQAPGTGSRIGRGAGELPFADTLRNAIDRADGAQKTADAEIQAFVAGESDNVHDAMIAMNEAELHFQLLTEVRNKLLDGYQELMRMQI